MIGSPIDWNKKVTLGEIASKYEDRFRELDGKINSMNEALRLCDIAIEKARSTLKEINSRIDSSMEEARKIEGISESLKAHLESDMRERERSHKVFMEKATGIKKELEGRLEEFKESEINVVLRLVEENMLIGEFLFSVFLSYVSEDEKFKRFLKKEYRRILSIQSEKRGMDRADPVSLDIFRKAVNNVRIELDNVFKEE